MLFYEWNTCINGIFWFLDFFLEIILGKSFFCIGGRRGGLFLIWIVESVLMGGAFKKNHRVGEVSPYPHKGKSQKLYLLYLLYQNFIKLLYWLYFIMVMRYALSIWQDEVGQTLVIMLSGWPHIFENSWKCLNILQFNFCISGLNIVVEKKEVFQYITRYFSSNFYITLEYTGISMSRLWYLNLNLV